MKPLQKPVPLPLENGAQGDENEDWATEWEVDVKWNSIMSPAAAVMLLGE
jgi:hypothetical protein